MTLPMPILRSLEVGVSGKEVKVGTFLVPHDLTHANTVLSGGGCEWGGGKSVGTFLRRRYSFTAISRKMSHSKQ